jgi:hypothetical protein
VILHGTSTTRNALDATQTITSPWAQFRRDGFFNPNKLSAKARRHNRGVYRQRRGAGRDAPDRDVSDRVSVRRAEAITEKKGIN